MKPPLLYVTHRIPFPPNKGDKIRTYHFLSYLAERFRVYLATFIDDPADLAFREQVGSLCAEAYFVRLRPRLAKLKSLSGLMRGEPLSCAYYRHRGMADWIRRTVEGQGIDNILVSSSGVAPFVAGERFSASNRVVDFIDVDSEKWRQYATQAGPPLSWLYRREAGALAGYERALSSAFEASLLVSPKEAELFRRLAPGSEGKVDSISNGVDLDYFDKTAAGDSPYEAGETTIVFTGAMDYRPNVDAVVYFAEEVLPLLLRRVPNLVFAVVGGKPDSRVLGLGDRKGVRVVGRVADVRPYVVHATASVAPLRIARGIQNKVLESMAMEVPTVVTPEALEGIDARSGREVLVGTDPETLATHLLAVIAGGIDRTAMGRAARAFVTRNFSWDDNLSRLERYFPSGTGDAPSADAAASR